MTSALHTGEELGGRSTAQAIALMRPPLVVELHERVEAALHRSAAREVLAAKLDPPVLVQDRPPCLRRPPKPPPEVQLERQVEARAVEVLLRRARPQGVQGEALLGESLVGVARLAVQLWELCCARDAELRPRLRHPGDGETQV